MPGKIAMPTPTPGTAMAASQSDPVTVVEVQFPVEKLG